MKNRADLWDPFPLIKTACKPLYELPSVSTAKETFFCFRMDFIHPETVVVDDGDSGGAADNNWRIVGARRYAAGCGGEEEAAVDANRRKIIGQAKNIHFKFLVTRPSFVKRTRKQI